MNLATTEQCVNVDCQHIRCPRCGIERHEDTEDTGEGGHERRKQSSGTKSQVHIPRLQETERPQERRQQRGLEDEQRLKTAEELPGWVVQGPRDYHGTGKSYENHGGEKRQPEAQSTGGAVTAPENGKGGQQALRKRKPPGEHKKARRRPKESGPSPLYDSPAVSGSTNASRKWPCLFYKLNPDRWPECRGTHSTVAYVKQHLGRTLKHRIEDNACPKCESEFCNETALEAHITEAICGLEYKGVRPKTLKFTLGRKDTPEEQWYSLWDRVFPGVPRPCTPVVMRDEAECFSQWLAINSLPVLRRILGDFGVQSSEAEKILHAVGDGNRELWSRYIEQVRGTPRLTGPSRFTLRLRSFNIGELEEWAAGPGLLEPVSLPLLPWDRVILEGRDEARSINRKDLWEIRRHERQSETGTFCSASRLSTRLPELEEWSPDPGRLKSIGRTDLEDWNPDPELVSLPNFPWSRMILEGQHRAYAISREDLCDVTKTRQQFSEFSEEILANIQGNMEWPGAEDATDPVAHLQPASEDTSPPTGAPTAELMEP